MRRKLTVIACAVGNAGCIRVIPGSHRHDHPVRTTPGGLVAMLEAAGLKPEENPFALPIPTKLGDCIVFNHDCFHASFGGGAIATYHGEIPTKFTTCCPMPAGSRRRMFTLNCTRHAKRPADLATLRKYISIHSPGANNKLTHGGMFYPSILHYVRLCPHQSLINIIPCAFKRCGSV
eukprot:SAG31_NODE_367_length_16811_cov_20.811584_16_plen_177_part_00